MNYCGYAGVLDQTGVAKMAPRCVKDCLRCSEQGRAMSGRLC